MTRSNFATHDLFAVSALLMETALNTEKTLDTGMLCDLASTLSYDRRSESNADEAIGKEEPDDLYDLGALASMDLSFSKAQAQHAGFIMAYALGSRSVAAAGAGGYKHTIVPITGDLDSSRSNPSFTAAMRHGKHLLKERFASCFIDNFTLTLAKDSWMKLKAGVKSTGKRTTNIYEESVTAAYNVTTLTLAANSVAGADAPERLANVHAIRVQVPSTLEWVDVVYTVVSAGPPSAITIVAPGVPATSTTYKILYNIAEASTYSWCVFPPRVVEPPLRVTDFSVIIDGKWDGSVIAGGHTLDADINSFEWTFNNNLTPEFVPGAGSGSYANRALREGRTQKITLDRKFLDYLIGNIADLRTSMVIYMKAEGPEYVSGHKYTVEVIFPEVAVQAAPISVGGKRLDEKADIVVLENSTYGSVIVNVKNMCATYAA